MKNITTKSPRLILKTIFVSVVMLLISAAGASAATIYVSPSGADEGLGNGSFISPYRTLTKAIEVAGAGDVIWADAGTYDTAAGETFPIEPTSNLVIQGLGFSYCFLSGNQLGETVKFDTVSNALISGFTISGGGPISGGLSGVNIYASSANVSRNRITGNHGAYGAGINVNINSTGVIENNIIDNNIAVERGGGICVAAGSTASIVNNTITQNSILADDGLMSQGSGLFCEGGTTTAFNNIIWGNIVQGAPSLFSENYGSGVTPAQAPPYQSIIQEYNSAYGGSNIYGTDPGFLNALGGDFRVTLTPPIDSGTATGAPTRDINGTSRPQGSGYDMGAYEIIAPPDTAVPTGSLSIDDDASVTSSTTVALDITGTDTGGSGLVLMRFSNDGTTWSPWVSYATTFTGWNLSLFGGNGVSGTKTVYAQVRDAAGNPSVSFSDEIALNYPTPAGTVTIVATSVEPGYSTSNNVNLDVTVNITDTPNVDMRFSNDPTCDTDPDAALWTVWTDYAADRDSWNLTDLTLGGTDAQGTKKVYVQFKYDTQESAVASDTIVYDSVSPAASQIIINSGNAATVSTTVNLTTIGATDTGGSGVARMRLSNDGSTWRDGEADPYGWIPFATSLTGWDLTSHGGSSAQGAKTVYIQFQDAAGNYGGTQATDTIIFDTTNPAGGSVSINGGAPTTYSTSVTLSLILPTDTGGSGVTQMRISNDGATWHDGESDPDGWVSVISPVSWSLTGHGGSAGYGTKTVYIQFRDAAGNATTAEIKDTINYAQPPPAPTNRGYIVSLYRNLLGRPFDPSEPEISYWMNVLISTGYNRQAVAAMIASSHEEHERIVDEAYMNILGRHAENAGLQGWANAMDQWMSTRYMQAAIYGSEEFKAAYPDNTAYVAFLYDKILHRGTDPTGVATWTGYLNAGVSRFQVAYYILTSDENYMNNINRAYDKALQRPPDPSGSVSWLNWMRAGMTEETMESYLFGSDEYFARFAF